MSQIRDPVRHGAWSPDEKRVALATDDAVDVHDAWSGELLVSLRNLGHRIEAMLFTPDGRSLAILGDGEGNRGLELWLHPLGGGAPTRCFSGLHGAADRQMAISADGTRIAVWVTTFYRDHERMSAVVWRGPDAGLLTWQEEGREMADLPVRRLCFDESRPDAVIAWLDGAIERWTWGAAAGPPRRDPIAAVPEPAMRKSFSAPRAGRAAFAPRYDGALGGIAGLDGAVETFALPESHADGYAEVALDSDGSWHGLAGRAIHQDPSAWAHRLPGRAAEIQPLGKTSFLCLSHSGRLAAIAREPGHPEILSVAGDRIDLSEEARIAKVARPSSRSTAGQRRERRARVAALADAGFSGEAVAAYRRWLAAQDVPLWSLAATTPPVPESVRSGLLRYFRKARARWLEPHLEEGLIALRPWQDHIPWKYKQRLPKLLDDSSLAQVQALSIEGDELAYGPGSADPLARRLAASRQARNLVDLTFSGMGLSASGVRALARSRRLQGLRRLAIHWEQVGRAARDIAASFPHLTHLTLDFCLAGDARLARDLRSAPWAGGLRWLDLSANGLPTAAAEAIADAPFAPTLEALRLGRGQSGNPLGDDGARALAGGDFRSLVHLDLSGTALGPKGLGALLASKTLATVVDLALDDNALGLEGLRLLAERGPDALPRLKRLGLSSAKIVPKEIEALLSTPFCARLEALDLCFNEIGDDGARALADSPHLKRLAHLSVDYCRIEDMGILAGSSVLPKPAREAAFRSPAWRSLPSGLVAESRWIESLKR